MNIKYPLLILVILLFSSSMVLTNSAQAEIYKWIDKDGNLQFGDKPPVELKSENIELKINTVTIPVVSTIPDSANRNSPVATSKNVVMYSTSWCGYCKKARKFMREQKISFSEYDIEKSASAKRRYDRLGGSGVPLIVVGNQKMSGFSANKLLALLK